MSDYLFPVDASLVLQFARAVNDPSPFVDDPMFARSATSAGIVPPPTFLIAGDHFDPECRRRPVPGEAWPGSGRVIPGWAPTDRGGRGLHAQQSFEYYRHPRIGELLTVTSRPGETWAKRGRTGVLSFVETVTEYVTDSGEPVVTARWVRVGVLSEDAQVPAGAPVGVQTQAADTAVRNPPADAEVPTPVPETRPVAADIRPGQAWTARLVDRMTLSHMVRYAGASGDFIGLHHDPQIARIVGGYPDAFAHGMLTMGLTGSVLTTLFGTENLKMYSGRMLAIVYPGDSLTATVCVRSRDHSAVDGALFADLGITTRNQKGEIAFAGTARTRLGD
jgi:acyl dehydratase